jgi:photosystem II stability/assembly factor-like uncharacterized protein
MKKGLLAVATAVAMVMAASYSEAARKKKPVVQEEPVAETRMKAETFAGLELRGIGPALLSGRIADIVVVPEDRATWYVAVSSGGVWKTVNAGTTWTPIFDGEKSYSIGCLALDPSNSNVVWVGTGENASQRSVGYGDGVYRSLDGGASWTRVGLEKSEHIGKILIDPRDTDVVYVASQGPLWAPGGDRGLYKTTDGGETWKRVLEVSENTGITDIAFDPRDPDVLYAASYQRRRHPGILVAGGPESAVYKSTDAGASWRKLTRGLPDGDVGRIALAVSPQRPDVVYALIAAEGEDSGFFRSTDRGESWEKRNDYIVVDPQYYGEIYPDPHRFDRVYAVDVWIHVTDDGGRTFREVNSRYKHVDNHAMVFDPDDPDYLVVGTDGGIYETFDETTTWRFVTNLPITQFYRVGVDEAKPFYNVYGGTQDNNTLGGPSRTHNRHGIRNSDWFVTLGGDGFEVRIDPVDPNIVYCMYQYAGIVRYDRKSGQRVDIQPQAEPGEPPLRWHWDSPLVISPHSHTRLYFAANRLYRSDDRGNNWRAVSPELSRGLDRNSMEVMGRVWGVDAVWKNVFTSPFGTIVALDESPLVEGLLYAGTDDGLVQVSEDGGENWRKQDAFPGVPDMAYVTDVMASLHDADTVYAVFNHHKRGDFAPFVVKSTDRGRTWTSIVGDLPEDHGLWTIAQDHERDDLLFVGTEFGLFFTVDGGERWVRLIGGVPPIQVRDLEIQRRENDLVAATFGRGFYVLDDYTALREITEERLDEKTVLFPVKDAWMYIESAPLGWGEKGQLGDALFTAPNPPFGAVFTYYLGDSLATRKQRRKRDEASKVEAGEPIYYPPWDELRAEDRERPPEIVLIVSDDEGNVVRRVSGPTTAGFHRVAWDLRFPAPWPVTEPDDDDRSGLLAAPGRYTVRLSRRVDGVLTPLGEAREFEAVPLGLESLPATDRAGLVAFQRKTARLQRAVLGTYEYTENALERLALIRRALDETPGATPELYERATAIEHALLDVRIDLAGDRTITSRAEYAPPSIRDRLWRVVGAWWSSTSEPTGTHRRNYEVAAEAFEEVLGRLRRIVADDLGPLEVSLEQAGAPWTPGRPLPDWSPE